MSFDVREGETFGLVGESGCGKTTIGRLVVALEKPDRGRDPLRRDRRHQLCRGELRRDRRDLQLMFQDPYASLDPRMRVGTILREPLAVQSIGSRREQRQRVAELLARSACRQARSSSTRTSSPAASASGSASPAPSRSTPA